LALVVKDKVVSGADVVCGGRVFGGDARRHAIIVYFAAVDDLQCDGGVVESVSVRDDVFVFREGVDLAVYGGYVRVAEEVFGERLGRFVDEVGLIAVNVPRVSFEVSSVATYSAVPETFVDAGLRVVANPEFLVVSGGVEWVGESGQVGERGRRGELRNVFCGCPPEVSGEMEDGL
jgi:hypothetical protein